MKSDHTLNAANAEVKASTHRRETDLLSVHGPEPPASCYYNNLAPGTQILYF